MSTATQPHAAPAQATGPTAPDAKRIAARNATTHGLFARDVVLPHLGEDPAAYEALLQELAAQLKPTNLLEQHYTEKIAAASWRLRRLQRWQAQLFEDPSLPEDAVLAKLDRVMRHETNLHRQIDTSVRMLGRELPKLFGDRVRQELLRGMNATEKDCREDPAMNEWITAETRRRLPTDPIPPGLDLTQLDNCQNEPAPAAMPAPPDPPDSGGPCEARNECSKVVGISALRKARKLQQKQKCQNEPAPAPPSSASPWQGEVASLSEPEGDVLKPKGVLREGVLQRERDYLTFTGISNANLETRTWGGISMG